MNIIVFEDNRCPQVVLDMRDAFNGEELVNSKKEKNLGKDLKDFILFVPKECFVSQDEEATYENIIHHIKNNEFPRLFEYTLKLIELKENSTGFQHLDKMLKILAKSSFNKKVVVVPKNKKLIISTKLKSGNSQSVEVSLSSANKTFSDGLYRFAKVKLIKTAKQIKQTHNEQKQFEQSL